MTIYKTNEELKTFSEQRKERASELLNVSVPEKVDATTYLVPSSDGTKKYRVSHIDTYSCECPDYLQRCKGQGLYCKHIQAIVLFNKLKNKVEMDDFDVEGITDERICPNCKSENITKFGVRCMSMPSNTRRQKHEVARRDREEIHYLNGKIPATQNLNAVQCMTVRLNALLWVLSSDFLHGINPVVSVG